MDALAEPASSLNANNFDHVMKQFLFFLSIKGQTEKIIDLMYAVFGFFRNYKNINREGKENAQTDDWNRCARSLPVIVNNN